MLPNIQEEGFFRNELGDIESSTPKVFKCKERAHEYSKQNSITKFKPVQMENGKWLLQSMFFPHQYI